MSADAIHSMVDLVGQGYTPNSVWESSLTYHIGSSVKINQTISGEDPVSGAAVTVPEGEVVTIIAIGGGNSGNDGHVLRADGESQAIIPRVALGESLKKVGEETTSEDLTGVVTKVTLSKPLPQSVVDWLQGGYMDYEVMLPMNPQSDSATALTFFMKAEDEEMLTMAVDTLKKMAGASYKSDAAATLTDWANSL